MKDIRVVFMGTPIFAETILEGLIKNYNVVLVVSQADKEKDRKGNLLYTPVKRLAIENDRPCYQPDNIRNEYEKILEYKPDIIVTCAYGQIISQEILDIPKYGVINVHASLLPKYRGSAPIQWAILNGEKETGITIMQTALGVDSGDIILQEKIAIKENETAGELFDDLAKMAPSVLMKAIDLIESGKATFTKQDESKATHFPMLKKEDGHINWTENGQSIINKIYGLNPWPSAFSTLDGKIFKIYKAHFEEGAPAEVGVIKDCKVACKDGYIVLEEVQIEGKKRMGVSEFLRGCSLNGQVLN